MDEIQTNPTQVGQDVSENAVKYAGFWVRVGAALIDTIFFMMLVLPVLYAMYGEEYFTSTEQVYWGIGDLLMNYVVPAIIVIVFWTYRSATPGKIILNMKIVDAETGEQPSTGKLIIRYLGYYVSAIPMCIGLMWVGFDERKQGWHDKLANTVVIRTNK